MFDSDTQFNDTHSAQTLDAEFVEVKKFQWVVPFLGGLFTALLIAAVIIAAYLMKMGPFAVSDRQTSLESAISGAADDISQQVDDAAALQETATLDPALNNQAVNIAGMVFGPNSIQAVAQLTSAETNGLVKCEPSLAQLTPENRAALSQVSCTLTPPQAAGAAPGQSTSPLTGATIAIAAANGRVTALTFTPAGSQAPAPAGDAPPSAPAETTAPTENTPKFEAAPSAPAAADSPPAPAGDAPPVQ